MIISDDQIDDDDYAQFNMTGMGGGGRTKVKNVRYTVNTIRQYDKKGFRLMKDMCLNFMKQEQVYVERFESLQECFKEQS